MSSQCQAMVQLRRGGWRNRLDWVPTSNTDDAPKQPQYTAAGDFIRAVVVAPAKAPKQKWVTLQLDGDMFVRDGVALVSVSPELAALGDVRGVGTIYPIGYELPCAVEFKAFEECEVAGVCALHVGVLK